MNKERQPNPEKVIITSSPAWPGLLHLYTQSHKGSWALKHQAPSKHQLASGALGYWRPINVQQEAILHPETIFSSFNLPAKPYPAKHPPSLIEIHNVVGFPFNPFRRVGKHLKAHITCLI